MAFLDSDKWWINYEMLLDFVPELKDDYPQSTICKWEDIVLVSVASVNIENIDLAVEQFSNICVVGKVDENGELKYLDSEKTMCEQIEEFDSEVGAFHETRDTVPVDSLTRLLHLVQITSSLNHGRPCNHNITEDEDEEELQKEKDELWAFL